MFRVSDIVRQILRTIDECILIEMSVDSMNHSLINTCFDFIDSWETDLFLKFKLGQKSWIVNMFEWKKKDIWGQSDTLSSLLWFYLIMYMKTIVMS